MTEHDQHIPMWARWALGIAQVLILGLLAWFGSTLLTVHDDVTLNTYKLNQVQQSAATMQSLQQQVSQLQWNQQSLLERQAKDDAFREAHSADVKGWAHP